MHFYQQLLLVFIGCAHLNAFNIPIMYRSLVRYKRSSPRFVVSISDDTLNNRDLIQTNVSIKAKKFQSYVSTFQSYTNDDIETLDNERLRKLVKGGLIALREEKVIF